MVLFFLFVWNSYCTNISFYLVLKAKRIPAHNHPVIERLLTYRNVRAAFSYCQHCILWKQNKNLTCTSFRLLLLFLVISRSSSMNLERLMLGSLRSTVSFCLVGRNITVVRCECLFERKRWVNFPVCIFENFFTWGGVRYVEYLCWQKSAEPVPDIEVDSNSDLDEEAALHFYREIEEQVKLKRKAKNQEDEE